MQGTNEMTGGEALAKMILAHGGGPMFGMGGFQLLPFYLWQCEYHPAVGRR